MADVRGRKHSLAMSCGSDDGWAVLRVRDSGPGVSPEVIARMFNPFFTTRAAGTGLGLAIVHRIIDAHAGRIRVTNNKDGPWATFELLLPPEPQTESPTLVVASSEPETSR
jgi:two-component system sensor histidine kinase AtoS